MDEAVAVEELGHDVGFQEHVVRRAGLLALEQVRVVTDLHTQGDRQCIIKALLMLEEPCSIVHLKVYSHKM